MYFVRLPVVYDGTANMVIPLRPENKVSTSFIVSIICEFGLLNIYQKS